MKKVTVHIFAFFANTKKGLLFCYVIMAFFLLAWNVFYFAYDHAQAESAPAVTGTENLADEGNGWYTSTSSDPQLLLAGLDTGVRRVVLQCEFEQPPGEVDLYYMREGDAAFSPGQRVWGRPLEGGGYEFLLPPGRVTALRIDPGNAGGNRVLVSEVILNGQQPVWLYFVPSLRGVLAFALLPALAYCAIWAIIEITMMTGKGRQ